MLEISLEEELRLKVVVVGGGMWGGVGELAGVGSGCGDFPRFGGGFSST